jgi:hypothetical protein
LVVVFAAIIWRKDYRGGRNAVTHTCRRNTANQLAELSAGLDIIQEAFTDYQTAVANGQSRNTASANLRHVLKQAIRVWTQESKQEGRQLRVGW